MISLNFEQTNLGYDILIGYHKESTISRGRTMCCALGSLSMDNDTTLEQIKLTIDSIKSENAINPVRREGGERAVFVMTLPNEKALELALTEFGFTEIYQIHRRNFYPEDSMLKMWIYSW